jgi:hypothetical protein
MVRKILLDATFAVSLTGCSNGVTGYEVVGADSNPQSSANPQFVQAHCPSGKKVLGGGAAVVSQQAQN